MNLNIFADVDFTWIVMVVAFFIAVTIIFVIAMVDWWWSRRKFRKHIEAEIEAKRWR